MTREEKRVIKAALNWWKSHRPCDYSRKEHLDNPEINCMRGADHPLAVAVAAYVKGGSR